jgi:hypothetical protein
MGWAMTMIMTAPPPRRAAPHGTKGTQGGVDFLFF